MLKPLSRREVILYHGTMVDYRKLLVEGLRPISRSEVVNQALSIAKGVLGTLPSGAYSIVELAAEYYRRRHRAGLYFSSVKEIAMFYAPFGSGGEAVGTVADAILNKYAQTSVGMEEMGRTSIKLCYVVTTIVPISWVMSGSRGESDEHTRGHLLLGMHALEVRLKSVVLPGMFVEVEQFYYTPPLYEKAQSEHGPGLVYKQKGVAKQTPLETVWRRQL